MGSPEELLQTVQLGLCLIAQNAIGEGHLALMVLFSNREAIRLFGCEIVVERAFGQAGFCKDFSNAGRLKAIASEQGKAGIDEPVIGCVIGFIVSCACHGYKIDRSIIYWNRVRGHFGFTLSCEASELPADEHQRAFWVSKAFRRRSY